MYTIRINEKLIDNLKQFIVATVQQATSHLANKDNIANMANKDDIARLEHKIDDLDLKVDTIAESLDERSTKLEL